MEMTIPQPEEMLRAFLGADASYDGIFYTGVRTTGIFCRPSCSARKPKPENVEFFPSSRDALHAGYRPCKRCRPMESPGDVPPAMADLMRALDGDPQRRWRDQDLRDRGLNPATVRRWFQRTQGMTFHAYARARRLGSALDELRRGEAVTATAFDHGFDSLSGFGEAVRKLTGDAPGRSRAATIRLRRLLTPLGPMVAGSLEDRLVLLEFTDRRMIERQLKTLARRHDAVLVPGTSDVLDVLGAEIEGYLEGRPVRFSATLDAPGTAFQERVWAALREIPRGGTVSYQELAERIGRPTAMRAVARANGDNRIAILIPCHRVIGKDGSLTGYGGGMWRKRRLLELEGAWPSA